MEKTKADLDKFTEELQMLLAKHNVTLWSNGGESPEHSISVGDNLDCRNEADFGRWIDGKIFENEF